MFRKSSLLALLILFSGFSFALTQNCFIAEQGQNQSSFEPILGMSKSDNAHVYLDPNASDYSVYCPDFLQKSVCPKGTPFLNLPSPENSHADFVYSSSQSNNQACLNANSELFCGHFWDSCPGEYTGILSFVYNPLFGKINQVSEFGDYPAKVCCGFEELPRAENCKVHGPEVLRRGYPANFMITCYDSNGNPSICSEKPFWNSSNAESVDFFEDNRAYALSEGTSTITANTSRFSCSLDVETILFSTSDFSEQCSDSCFDELTGQFSFDWSWKNVGEDFCDASDGSAVFCDATQFSISLLKKLRNAEPKSRIEFEALLLADAFSPDFQIDFDYYYKNVAFFDTPEFYLSEEDGLSNYFSDPSLFRFLLNQKPFTASTPLKPGTYSVTMIVPRDYNPVSPKNPVIVYFEFLTIPENESIFHFLPLNGEVGLHGTKIDRIGYGVDYTGTAPAELPIDSLTTLKFSSFEKTSNAVATITNFSSNSTLEQLNSNNNKPVLLKIKRNANIFDFEFNQSIPTPLLLELKNKKSFASPLSVPVSVVRADGFPLNFTNPDFSFSWQNAFDSCLDFSGAPLETKNSVRSSNNSAVFSFSWPNHSWTGFELLKTIIYSGADDQKVFLQSTSENLNNDFLASFFSASENGRRVFLSGTGINLVDSEKKSLIDIFKLVEQGYAVVEQSPNEAVFYWNEPKLFELLEVRKQSLIAECIALDSQPDEPINNNTSEGDILGDIINWFVSIFS
ncbi:MAG: hypothetical protein NUV57_00135 [archaeon]|nr:hypothetical protein [archaeon]